MVSIGLILGAVALIIFVTQFKGIERTKEAITEAKSIKDVVTANFDKLRKKELSTGTEDRSVEDK